MKDKDDNITSIHPGIKHTSTGTKAGKSNSQYIPPKTFGNPSEQWILPPNEILLEDFYAAGGSIEKHLDSIGVNKANRQSVAIQIVEQLEADEASAQKFLKLRMAADKAAALLARDEIIRVSQTRGGTNQLAALKIVAEWTTKMKEEPKKGRGIEDHLEDFNA
jgi:hypothetical protein